MSLTKQQVSEYRRLKDSGVDVHKHDRIAFHRGEETAIHACAKILAGLLALRNGYRVDSEVPVTDNDGNENYIDVLAWGHDSRLTYALEPDHSPTVETRDHKIAKYVERTAVDDIQLINLNDMPMDMMDAFAFISDEIGLEP